MHMQNSLKLILKLEFIMWTTLSNSKFKNIPKTWVTEVFGPQKIFDFAVEVHFYGACPLSVSVGVTETKTKLSTESSFGPSITFPIKISTHWTKLI